MHPSIIPTRGLGIAQLLLAIPLLAGVTSPARADHTEFEFNVERFEMVVDGGSPQIDDFAAGPLSPWTIGAGTAFESGGVLVLTDPGDHRVLPGFGVTLDVSSVNWAGSGLEIESDFEMESTWKPMLPEAPGQRFAMVVSYSDGSGDVEFVALVLQNLGTAEAAPFGLPAGLRMVQLRGSGTPDLDNLGEFLTLSFPLLESVPVSPASVTDDIVQRIDWDSTAREFTTSFSLDGGATMLTPFPTANISAAALATGDMTVGLIADPAELTAAVPTLGSIARGCVILLLVATAYLRTSQSMRPRQRLRISGDRPAGGVS